MNHFGLRGNVVHGVVGLGKGKWKQREDLPSAFKKSIKCQKVKMCIMSDVEMGRVFLSVVGLHVVGRQYFRGERCLNVLQQDFRNKGKG
jgi:hypothetical protein